MQANEDCTVDFGGYIVDCIEDTSDIHLDQTSMRGVFPENWINFTETERLVAMIIPEYDRTLSLVERRGLKRELESFSPRLNGKHCPLSHFTDSKDDYFTTTPL